MKIKRRNVIWGALALVSIVCLYLVVVLGFWFIKKDKIYPGVSVAGVSLAGMNEEEAAVILEEKIKEYLSAEMMVDEDSINILDLKIEYQIENTVKKTKEFSSNNPFVLGLKKDYTLEFDYDYSYFYEYLKDLEIEQSWPVFNSVTQMKDGEIEIVDGKNGQQINYSESTYLLEEAISSLGNKTTISTVIIPPTYSSADLEERLPEIKEMFGSGFTLTYESNKFDVSLDEMAKWVQLSSKKSSYAAKFEGDYIMTPLTVFNNSNDQLLSIFKVESYLGNLSEKINTEPINAELAILNGKAAVFVDSRDGKMLNISESATAIQSGLYSERHEVVLVVNLIKPVIHTGSLNNLGIKELIATGYSNFAGSPNNRRHNIRIGAEKFNGLLIKPDEIFSFTANLGEVDAENGYLPELVIKDKETIPEYGGGLCQVSSTAFRAALNAGLPIVARKAHSYPVTYYKPYGTDATIYIPNPDLKFKNDTEGHILIQTRIVGNYLYFDFYGTKLDRTVKFAGNKNASGAVSKAEWVTPYTYDYGGRGEGSFKAMVYRFIYDSKDKLINSEYFYSNYDSPDKYPH